MDFAKNKYVRRAKISEYKFRKMVKYFAEDMSATQIAIETAINRNTVNRYLNEIRSRMMEFCEQYAPFNDQPEETHFFTEENEIGLHAEVICEQLTIKEKITTNLGILKRRGKVYAEMLANCTASKLQQLLHHGDGKLKKVLVHSVDVNEPEGLIAVGYDSNQEFADKPSYVDNLDKFWSFTKERTAKFQGVAKHKFYLHLKECEFRFNFRNDNLYVVLLKLLSAKPLS